MNCITFHITINTKCQFINKFRHQFQDVQSRTTVVKNDPIKDVESLLSVVKSDIIKPDATVTARTKLIVSGDFF